MATTISNYTEETEIIRPMEENLLNDFLKTPESKFIAGVDSPEDVLKMNYKFKSLEDKIQALLALLYYKESTILTQRDSNPRPNSIFFNKATKQIEIFDGQRWNSNILGSSVIIEHGTYFLNDFEPNLIDEIPRVYLNYFQLPMDLGVDEILFLIVDGNPIPKELFFVKSETERNIIIFKESIVMFKSIEYYVLGSETDNRQSIPKYEVVEYTSDGRKRSYRVSKSPYFLATYKSSVEVTINGIQLRQSEYQLNPDRNSILLLNTPNLNDKIEIKTLYGVETDFTDRLTLLEQSDIAISDRQKYFIFNGVSDSLVVFLDGIRLMKNIHYSFDYAGKKVIIKDDYLDKVKEGSICTVVHEYVNQSVTPLYGYFEDELILVPDSNFVELSKTPNGKLLIYKADGKIVPTGNYYVNEKIVYFNSNDYKGTELGFVYLSYTDNEALPKVKIDDLDNSSLDKTWSAYKLRAELNGKADLNGNKYQDFDSKNMTINEDLSVTRNATVQGFLDVYGKTHLFDDLIIGTNQKENFTVKADTGDTFVGRDLTVRRNTLIGQNLEVRGNSLVKGNAVVEGDQLVKGNLTVTGSFSRIETETIEMFDNIVQLNSNMKPNQTPTENAGIEVNRGSEAKAVWYWDETLDKWVGGVEGQKVIPASLEGHVHPSTEIIGLQLQVISDTDSDTYISVEKDPNNVKDQATDYLDNDIIAFYNKGIRNAEMLSTGDLNLLSHSFLQLPVGNSSQRPEKYPRGYFNSTALPIENVKNGMIRYNSEKDVVEFRIAGSWVYFKNPNPGKEEVEFYSSIRQFFNRSDLKLLTTVELTELTELDASADRYYLKVNHNLAQAYVNVQIFNDKRHMIIPDEVILFDENVLYVDLTSYILTDNTLPSSGLGFIKSTKNSNVRLAPVSVAVDKKWCVVVSK